MPPADVTSWSDTYNATVFGLEDDMAGEDDEEPEATKDGSSRNV